MRCFKLKSIAFGAVLSANFLYFVGSSFSAKTEHATEGKHTEAQKKALSVLDKDANTAKADFDHKAKKAYRSPFLATSSIIEIFNEKDEFLGIVLITRCNSPLGKAIPGGHVEYGDSIEDTVVREMKEETGLDIYDIKQFHAYSKPNRDPRKHMIDFVCLSKAKGVPKGNTDAETAFIVTLDNIPWSELVFDHAEILRDYIHLKNGDASKQVLVPNIK